MAQTHAGKEVPEGIKAFGNLLNMLFEAALGCKVSVRVLGGRNYNGILLDGAKFWVGLVYTDPGKLTFCTRCRIDHEAAARLGVGKVMRQGGTPVRFRWWREAALDSDSVGFFARNTISQMQWIEAFLRDCLEKARAISTADQPSGPGQPGGV